MRELAGRRNVLVALTVAAAAPTWLPSQVPSVPLPCPGASWKVFSPRPATVKTTIEDSPDTALILLPTDTLDLDSYLGVVIQRKRCLRIVGQDRRTVVRLGPRVSEGFRISDSVAGLELSHFVIQGTPGNGSVNRHAIVGRDGTRGIRRVVLTDLEIRDLNVGIIVGAGIDGDFDSVWVARNAIHDMRGSGAPRGYGIQNANASNVWIEDNRLAHIDRHAIYQARGRRNIVIEGNLILDHARNAGDQDWRHVALSGGPLLQRGRGQQRPRQLLHRRSEHRVRRDAGSLAGAGHSVDRQRVSGLAASRHLAQCSRNVRHLGQSLSAAQRQAAVRADQGNLKELAYGRDTRGAIMWNGRLLVLRGDCYRVIEPATGVVTAGNCER